MFSPILALPVTFILSIVWLRIIDWAAARGLIESRLSRKIIHMGTGPLFVLCWLLFNDHPASRWLAALVPLLITAQFFLVGTGVIQDEAAVQAMSRTGDRREILKGPLIYGVVFVLLTILFWKDSPIGIVALMLLCGGDGLADVIGRRWSTAALPWNSRKTWGGSLFMFAGGWIFSAVILGIYVWAGIFPGPMPVYLAAITITALIGTVVEMLPVRDFDNATVPLAAVITGFFLF